MYQDMDDCWDSEAKAAIHRLSGYSAHADQKGLCDWVKSMPEPPGEIRLVMGSRKYKVPSNHNLLFYCRKKNICH